LTTLRVTREVGFGIELRRGRFTVAVDGTPFGSIESDGDAAEASLEPGHHRVRVLAGRYSSRELSFDANDGELVEFRCHGTKIWPGYLASIVRPDMAISLQRH
jgi:hypothetical protein